MIIQFERINNVDRFFLSKFPCRTAVSLVQMVFLETQEKITT